MTDTPNPADFSRNERARDYTAVIRVHGTISISIQADSKEDAQRQADAEIERMEKEGYVEIDTIDELDLSHMQKDRPMFRVTRDGSPMQVSHLKPGDVPRQPDEQYGF